MNDGLLPHIIEAASSLEDRNFIKELIGVKKYYYIEIKKKISKKFRFNYYIPLFSYEIIRLGLKYRISDIANPYSYHKEINNIMMFCVSVCMAIDILLKEQSFSLDIDFLQSSVAKSTFPLWEDEDIIRQYNIGCHLLKTTIQENGESFKKWMNDLTKLIAFYAKNPKRNGWGSSSYADIFEEMFFRMNAIAIYPNLPS